MHPSTSLYISLVTYTTETACSIWSHSMTMESSNQEHKVRTLSVLFLHPQLFFIFDDFMPPFMTWGISPATETIGS